MIREDPRYGLITVMSGRPLASRRHAHSGNPGTSGSVTPVHHFRDVNRHDAAEQTLRVCRKHTEVDCATIGTGPGRNRPAAFLPKSYWTATTGDEYYATGI